MSRSPGTAGVGSAIQQVLRAAHQPALTGLALVVSRAAGLLTVPVYARILGPEDFGRYELLITIIALLYAIGILGMDYAVAVRFFPLGEADRDRDLVSAVVVAAAGSAIAAFGLLVSAPLVAPAMLGSDDWIPYLLAVASVPLNVVSGVLAMHLRLRFRGRAFFGSVVGGVFGGAAVGLAAVMAGGAGLTGAMLGIVLTHLLTFLLLTRSCRGSIHPRLASWDASRRLLKIGLPLVPAGAAAWAFTAADRVFIAGLAGVGQLGLYAAAARLAALLAIIQYGFHATWGPSALGWGTSPDRDRKYAASLRFVAIAGGAAVAVMSWLAAPLLLILAGPQYVEAANVVWLLAGAVLFLAMFYVVQIGANLGQRGDRVAAATILAALVSVAANLALVPRFGYLGAGVASLTAFSAAYAAMYVMSQRVTRIRMGVSSATIWAAGWTVVSAMSVVVPTAWHPVAAVAVIVVATVLTLAATMRIARVLVPREAVAAPAPAPHPPVPRPGSTVE